MGNEAAEARIGAQMGCWHCKQELHLPSLRSNLNEKNVGRLFDMVQFFFSSFYKTSIHMDIKIVKIS